MKPLLIVIKEGEFKTTPLKHIGKFGKEQAALLSQQPHVANFVREINETTLEIKQLPVVIGRKEDTANILISSAYRDVSRTHAEIFEQEGEINARDLSSKTGTILLRQGQDPTKLTTRGTKLENNDILQLGKYIKLQIVFERGFVSWLKRLLG